MDYTTRVKFRGTVKLLHCDCLACDHCWEEGDDGESIFDTDEDSNDTQDDD